MKISVVIDEKAHRAVMPYKNATFASVPGQKCPGCKTDLKVHGVGHQERGYDTISSECRCVGCGGHIGQITVQIDTLFGLEEDEQVLGGRWRVY